MTLFPSQLQLVIVVFGDLLHHLGRHVFPEGPDDLPFLQGFRGVFHRHAPHKGGDHGQGQSDHVHHQPLAVQPEAHSHLPGDDSRCRHAAQPQPQPGDQQGEKKGQHPAHQTVVQPAGLGEAAPLQQALDHIGVDLHPVHLAPVAGGHRVGVPHAGGAGANQHNAVPEGLGRDVPLQHVNEGQGLVGAGSAGVVNQNAAVGVHGQALQGKLPLGLLHHRRREGKVPLPFQQSVPH